MSVRRRFRDGDGHGDGVRNRGEGVRLGDEITVGWAGGMESF